VRGSVVNGRRPFAALAPEALAESVVTVAVPEVTVAVPEPEPEPESESVEVTVSVPVKEVLVTREVTVAEEETEEQYEAPYAMTVEATSLPQASLEQSRIP